MIGTVIMEISQAEMAAAMQYYLNYSVFNIGAFRECHKATVIKVHQRGNGRFSIEFDGQPEPEEDATP